MTQQYVEAFVALPPNSLEPDAKNIRQFQYQIAQPDGTWKTVNVEGTILVDPSTGNPLTCMTYDQGEKIIELLTLIYERLNR